jgi:tetratricopeptide (TPR) repeat protein
MGLPATKAQQIASMYLPLLRADRAIDELVARRAIREARAAVADAASQERAVLFQLIGIASLRLEQHDRALEAFRNAVRWDPTSAKHRTNLAVLLNDVGQQREALAEIAAVGTADVHDRFVLELNRALVHHSLRDESATVAALRAARASLDPSSEENAFLLAVTLAEVGQAEDAVEMLGRAAALAANVDAAETPALELLKLAPETMRARVAELAPLALALAAALARESEETALGGPSLDDRHVDRIAEVLESPPKPTEALRELVRGRSG